MKLSNKALFAIHSWCGLNLGFLLFVICLSGTIATLSHEIDWLLDKEIRPTTQRESSAPISLHQAYDNVQLAYPHSNIYAIKGSNEDYMAIQFYLLDRDKGNLTVYVDPNNGALLAERDRLNIKNFFRIFHKQLFIVDTKFTFNGVLIVGLFGFSLLVTLISGFLFMGSWLKKLMRMRWDKGLRVFMADWHRSTGLWALVFSLLFALTGIWYWVEKAAGISEVQLAETNGVKYWQEPAHLGAPDLEMYLRNAKEALPGLDVAGFFLPGKPGQVAHVFGQGEAVLVRDAANYVGVDPYGGEVLAVRDATELGVLDRWLHTVDPLHFGSFGGLWTKAIWFLFGLLLTLSIPVGAYIWYGRIRATKGKNGIGFGRVGIALNVLSVAVLALSMVFSSLGILRMKAGAEATHNVTFDFQRLGPWRVALQHKLNADTGNAGTFELLFDRARPNLKSAQLYIEKNGESEVIESAFTLGWNAQRALIDAAGLSLENTTLEEALDRWYDKVDNLWISLEDHQGDIYQHRFAPNEIAQALSHIAPVGSAVKSHMPAQVFIIGFLVSIWLFLFVWGACCYSVFRRYPKEDAEVQVSLRLQSNNGQI